VQNAFSKGVKSASQTKKNILTTKNIFSFIWVITCEKIKENKNHLT